MSACLQVAERDLGDVTILQIKGQLVSDDGDGDLKLLRVPPRANRLLSMTRLASIFEIYDSEEAVVESFQPAPERG